MNATRILRVSARTPLIHFKGKRAIPSQIDHTPRAHPASPTGSLPSSFKQYRESFASTHGPLNNNNGNGDSASKSRGTFTPQPAKGMFMDRNELPARFRRLPMSALEMECVELGGAAVY